MLRCSTCPVSLSVSTSTSPTLSSRVAFRYAHNRPAGPILDVLSLTPADRGAITAADLQEVLKDRLGPLVSVRFTSLLEPPGAAWEALREDGVIVRGHVLVHVGVQGDRVDTWAEVLIDGQEQAGRPLPLVARP